MNMNNNFIQLYNILMENVNQISDDINVLKEEIEQEIGLENPSIKQIEELLNNPELFKQNERLKLKVKKYLNLLKLDKDGDTDYFNTLQLLLEKEIKLSSNFANDICMDLEDEFDLITIQKLINFLNKRELNEELDIKNGCGTICTFDKLFSTAKLDTTNDFISYLSNKTLPTIPATGKYELLFSILFRNGHRPTKESGGGDVKIGNATLEVKDSGARLGGQHAYGDSEAVAKYFKETFKERIKNGNYENKQDYINKINSLKNISFNFDPTRTKNNTNSFLILCNETNTSLKEAKNILFNGFLKLFKNEDVFRNTLKLSNFIDSLTSNENNNLKFDEFKKYQDLKLEKKEKINKINKLKNLSENRLENQEEINKLHKEIKDLNNEIKLIQLYLKNNQNFKFEEDFYKKFLYFTFIYYATIENFDYFAITSKDKFLILSREDFKNKFDDNNIITKNIHIKSMPTFSENSTDQDKKVSIELIG